MLTFSMLSVHAHVVPELMFLTYDQLPPPSIIVGTSGEAELTALECDWKSQKNKT